MFIIFAFTDESDRCCIINPKRIPIFIIILSNKISIRINSFYIIGRNNRCIRMNFAVILDISAV